MDIWLKFLLLVIAAYILGSIPLSYITARSRGVDIRKRGTHQVGTGNLWRTTSHALGFFVGAFDFLKGMLMVFIAYKAGLDASLQLFTGIAVIIGHNWPVFLRFHGGRGIATALGLIIIMPSLNAPAEITTWPLIAFFGIGIAVLFVAHRTPVPVLVALITLPITSAITGEPARVTIGYAVLLVIIIIKRLTAQPNKETAVSMSHVLLNRFLFDRDIKDRKAWVYRKDINDGDIPE
jgi:acyl phosphate:glycerol-3-phosphate acyltransferase